MQLEGGIIVSTVTPEIKEAISNLKVFPIATASADGKPNLICMSFLRIADDGTLQLGDNFFFKTR